MPKEIEPLTLEEALQTVRDNVPQRLWECVDIVERLARLGEAVQQMPTGWGLIHKHDRQRFNDNWWVQKLISNKEEILEYAGPVEPVVKHALLIAPNRHTGQTPMEALEKL